MKNSVPQIGVIMGSQSDWDTMHRSAEILTSLSVAHEVRIVSAHRTPKRLVNYAEGAQARGLKSIIAAAGGAAHLPGMVASLTILPVFGVPIESPSLKGMDSLLSIVQMPRGCPTATMAINGSFNAGLYAASIIGTFDYKIKSNLEKWKRLQTKSVKRKPY